MHNSESKYRKLSKEFQVLLDAIGDPLMLLSPEMKILWANSSTAVTLGDGASDLTGTYCHELWHCGHPCGNDCAAGKSFRTGKAENSQFSSRDGRFWETKAFPLKGESGEPGNVIFIASDITEEINLQAESIRAEQLTTLGELAAGVAHEINNPINGVINCAQLLLDESSPSNKDIVNRILKESDRIANVVRGLLSFVSDSEEDKGFFSMLELITDTLVLSGTHLRQNGIKVKTYIAADLPKVFVHSQQIQQVFLNVINNARYALNEKYPIPPYKDKFIEIIGGKRMINDRLHTQITFFDRGTGIPKDKQGKVMKSFFTTKPRGKGTGLGLSISRKIIIDNRGDIAIDSVEGEFTKVIISFPAKVDE